MTPSGTHGKYLELIELGYSLLVEWVDQMTMSSNLGLIILGLANCAFESHPGHLCMALSPLYMFLSLHTCLKWILIHIPGPVSSWGMDEWYTFQLPIHLTLKLCMAPTLSGILFLVLGFQRFWVIMWAHQGGIFTKIPGSP